MDTEARIVRIWRGWTTRADASAYEEYMRTMAIPAYTGVEGNRGACFTRRDVGDNTQFVLMTWWTSYEALRSFAGDDLERAVFFPEDERYLVDRDLTVAHYEVFATV